MCEGVDLIVDVGTRLGRHNAVDCALRVSGEARNSLFCGHCEDGDGRWGNDVAPQWELWVDNPGGEQRLGNLAGAGGWNSW